MLHLVNNKNQTRIIGRRILNNKGKKLKIGTKNEYIIKHEKKTRG